MIAPIQGGYNVKERIRSAKYLAEYNDVLGFLFDGFFTNGSIVEEIPSDLIMPVIDETMVFIFKKILIIYSISENFKKYIYYSQIRNVSRLIK